MTAISLTCDATLLESSHTSDEAALVERAKHDPQAMTQLYREHYLPIARYVLRRVGNRADADDVTAEVFLTMVRCLPRYKPRGAPFRAWLYRVATDHANRWSKRRRRWAQQRLDEPCAPSSPWPTTDESERVRLALMTLPGRFQSALSLHYIEELSIAEIMQVLRCAEGTVKSRLARGRELLRTILLRKEKVR